MRNLYESLLDDDDTVLKRADNRTLAYQVDEMLKSKTPNPELIKLLESKVAIYKVNDNGDLRNLIFDYIKLVGNNCSLNWIDVSNVKDMKVMFYRDEFNGDISKWDVSNVKNMSYMFYHSEFNGDISKWNVSRVESMNYMFYYSKFNGDISGWNVSNVEDMSCMFTASKFNGDISKWNVSNVKDMSAMFYRSEFNSDVSKWDVSKVSDNKFIFRNCPIKEEYKPKFK